MERFLQRCAQEDFLGCRTMQFVARKKIFWGVVRCSLSRATRFFGVSYDAVCRAQQDFFGVSYDAVCRAQQDFLGCRTDAVCSAQQDFLGCHTMQFVARNKIFWGVIRCSLSRATRFFGVSYDAVCRAQQDFLGCRTMQFVARNFAKVELDSSSANVARNVAGKVAQCVRAFSIPRKS